MSTVDKDASARRQRRERLRQSLVMGVLVSLWMLLFRGGFELVNQSGLVRPWNEFLRALPLAFISFIIITGLRYFSLGGKRVLCLKCGSVKNRDRNRTCSCGADFVDADEFEWQEDALKEEKRNAEY